MEASLNPPMSARTALRFAADLRLPTTAERSALTAWASKPGIATSLALGAALFGCWILTYWETWLSLTKRWNEDSNYSHGFLVPLVSLYLAAQAVVRRDAIAAGGGSLFVGAALILFGLSLEYVTVLFPSLVAECLSMLTVLAGGIVLLGGAGWWWRLQAPVLFLLFMVPWPAALYKRVAFPLQLFVSELATTLIELLGIPVLREGNVIQLPKQTMHVAEACSGLRQLTAFLAICTCAALLCKRPTWYRATLLLSSIPIAVAINVLRVTATGLALQYGYGSWTEGTMHTVEGLVMVGLGMGLLWLEVAVLDWMLVHEPKPAAEPANESFAAQAAG